MEEIIISAEKENLDKVLAFVDSILEKCECPAPTQMSIDIAVEEIFVNIASYAYNPEVGSASIRCAVQGDPPRVVIEFRDGGVPYDPLARPDPDINAPLEERDAGGLGIYMVKNSMDNVHYRNENGNNIFTIEKKIG